MEAFSICKLNQSLTLKLAYGAFSFSIYVFLASSDAAASDWTGALSSDWNTAQNWSTGIVPVNGSLININGVASNKAIADNVQYTGTTLNVGTGVNSEGVLDLTGGTSFKFNNVNVGGNGAGFLTIIDSSLDAAGGVAIGSSSYGKITISGENANLSVLGSSSHLNIGSLRNGDGHIEILKGAKVNVNNVSLGNLRGSGSITVDGAGSLLNINGRDLSAAGLTGDTSIMVTNGGRINIVSSQNPESYGLLQLGSNGQKTHLLISGAGSEISSTGNALIAEFGVVRARVDNQAKLTTNNHLIIGDGRMILGPDGELIIDNDAQVTVANDTVIGVGTGTGVLTLSGNSSLATAGVYIAHGATTSGTLNIGGAATEAAKAAGVLNTDKIIFGNGAGKLIFNHTASANMGPYAFSQKLTGKGNIEHYAGFTHFTETDNTSFSGNTAIFGGTMRIDGKLGGSLEVEQQGRLQGVGRVGNTVNRGTIAPGNSFGTLTVNGDYTGENGRLEIETALGGDNSQTDLLVVTNNTYGQTFVNVINVGGTGAQTVNGIKVIEVQGTSDGVFELESNDVYAGEKIIYAGAYGYRLLQHGLDTPNDGNWYLRSELTVPLTPLEPAKPLYQAGVPTYETYAQSLLGLNSVSTLQQRVGNRVWAGNGNQLIVQGADPVGSPYAIPSEAGVAIEGNGVWGRIEGSHTKMKPHLSTSDTDYNQNIFKMQAGIDGMLAETENGKLIGGVTVHYAHGKTKTDSVHGDGEISTNGYGFGGTLTWYGENGFYLDGQGQVTWYRSDLNSMLANNSLVKHNDGFGYALSIESGKRIALNEAWSLTPQAQLSYSHVDFDTFTDTYGARVSLDRGESLQGRLGVALDYENSWQNANGMLDRTHVYGIANLYYEFLEGTKVDVASTKFASRNDRVWGGVGLGGSYNWNDDKYSIYGEGLVKTSLNNFGDSYSLKGQVGLRDKW